ncbi:MAG: hypothetical protein WBP13_09805 [Methylophilaceae bacterium]
MSFYSNQYNVYVFLGNPQVKPIWHWDAWSAVSPHISNLIAVCRGKGAIRSNQLLSNGDFVKFGKMPWSEKANHKWTHGSPNTLVDDSVTLLSTEIWAPTWGACEKEDQSPDLYISIGNEAYSTPQEKLLFHAVVILAVETSVAEANKAIMDELVNKISTVTDVKLKVFKQRKWGKEAFGGFTSAINDMGICGLFKVGKPYERPLDLDTFQAKWDILP